MDLDQFGIRLGDGFPESCDVIVVGMGCFWGAERRYWTSPGVVATAVGYAGGSLDAPTYQQVCTGRTGHAEVVLAVFDTTETSYGDMLRIFWENHDPTQGDRQGADVGPQYRSAVYWITEEQRVAAESSRAAYQDVLTAAGYGPITTEIAPLAMFHPAEEYHQKYLAKNPNGYCGLGGTGVACPVGIAG